jgi:NADH:ubiquinone oxidoreductase subunit 5 (subunit L)/multisubunit Na+/H+ antiporter MnhA subunit
MEHLPGLNPAAPEHLPSFIPVPGGSDWLMTTMLVFLIVSVVSVGILYLKLHALPEHMAHRTNKVQLQFVAVLALLALFTHNHVFWIAGLLLALVELPDFSTPMNSIARSLERLSGRERGPGEGSRWDDVVSDDGRPEEPRPPMPPFGPGAGERGT